MVYENIFFRNTTRKRDAIPDEDQAWSLLIEMLIRLSAGVGDGNNKAAELLRKVVEEEMESFSGEMEGKLPAAREKLNRWLAPYKTAVDELAAIDLGADDLFDDSISITDSRLTVQEALEKINSIPSDDFKYEELITDFAYREHNELDKDKELKERLTNLGYEGEKVETPGKDIFFELWVFTPTDRTRRILLAFEGSDEIWDWLDDLNPTRPGPGGAQMQYFKELIEKEIDQFSKNSAGGKVDLGGHSLGGALAQYAATLKPEKIHSVVTFQAAGVPEAGIKSATNLPKDNNVRHYRVTGDIVTLAGESFLPGKIMIVSFLGLPPVVGPHTVKILKSLKEAESNPSVGISQIQYGDIRLKKRAGAPNVGETLRRLPLGAIIGEEEWRRFGPDKNISQIFKGASMKEDPSMKLETVKISDVKPLTESVQGVADKKIKKEDLAYEQLAKKFAYQSKIDSSEINKLGFTPEPKIAGASSFGLWVFKPTDKEKGRTVLAFEGSADLLDWLDDLNPDQAGPGYKQMTQNTGLILDTLRKFATKDKKVDVVGHSLGGALAQFAATLAPELINRVVTFQSPGIPHSKLKNNLPREVIHYLVDGDIVHLAGEAFLPGQVIMFHITGLSFIKDPHTVFPLEILDTSDTRIAKIQYGKVAGKRDGFPKVSEGLRQYIGAYVAPLDRSYFSIDLSPPRLYRTEKAQKFTDKAVGFVNLILDDLNSERLPARLNELADIVENDLHITATRLKELINRILDRTIEKLAENFSEDTAGNYALSRQLRKLKGYATQLAADYPLPEFNRELAFSQLGSYLDDIYSDDALNDLKATLKEYQAVIPEILPLALYLYTLAESQSTNNSGEEYSWYLSWFDEKVVLVKDRLNLPEDKTKERFGDNPDDLPINLVTLEYWTFWSRVFSDLFKGFLYAKQMEEGRKISPGIMAGYNFFSGFSSLAAINRQATNFIKIKNQPVFQVGMAELLPITGSIVENPPRDLREWIGARWPQERKKKNQGARLPELSFDLALSLFSLVNSNGQSHTKVKGFTQTGRLAGATLAAFLLGRPAERYKTGDWNSGWSMLTLLAGSAATFSMEIVGWLLAGAVSGKLSAEYWKFDPNRLLSGNNAYGSAAFQSFSLFSEIWEEFWDGNTDEGKIGLREVSTNENPHFEKCSFSGYPYHIDSPYKLPFAPGTPVLCLQGHMGFESNDFKSGKIYAVDFMLPSDTEVLAMRDGVVLDIKQDSDNPAKNYIVIRHEKKPTDVTVKQNTIILENLFFDFGEATIKEKYTSDLEMVSLLMKNNGEITQIELTSHTDNRGNDDYNLNLSQRRADATRVWLIDKGIDENKIKITAEGKGESEPFTVDEKTAAKYPFLKKDDILNKNFIDGLNGRKKKEIAHALNRRSEIKFTVKRGSSIKIESAHAHDKIENGKTVTTYSKYFGAKEGSITKARDERVVQGEIIMTLGSRVARTATDPNRGVLHWPLTDFLKPDFLKVLVYAEDGNIRYPTIPFVFSDVKTNNGVPQTGKYYASSNEKKS